MISVEHVSKYYGASAAVRDLDFTIAAGECVGFLGLNGAGKTTTLRLLSCLVLPTSGRVTIRGLDAERDPHEIRKFIGFLPDRPPLYQEMTVVEFMRFAGRLRQMAPADVERRLPEVLDTLALSRVADQEIGTLSHGYRQRVGIAQAIVHSPALLILDEPIQGLDPVQIVEMRGLIRALRGKHTILLSTHILSEIAQTCDRILMLHQGKVAAKGTEHELTSHFGGVQRVAVKVQGDIAALKVALARLPGSTVQEVTAGAGNLLQAVVTLSAAGAGPDAPDGCAQVAKAVVEAGLPLLSLQREASGLERIFLDMSRTGSGPRKRNPQPPSAGADRHEVNL